MQTDLLTLDFTRVTRDEAGAAQFGLERRVVVDQRAGDAQAQSAGLAGLATTVDVQFCRYDADLGCSLRTHRGHIRPAHDDDL